MPHHTGYIEAFLEQVVCGGPPATHTSSHTSAVFSRVSSDFQLLEMLHHTGYIEAVLEQVVCGSPPATHTSSHTSATTFSTSHPSCGLFLQ